MSRMRQVKITISEELYVNIRQKAGIIGISVPQFIKFAVMKEAQLNGVRYFNNDLKYLLKKVKEADMME